MTTLNTYEAQVLDLLHDPTPVKWSLSQIDNYINEARTQLVMDTGCLRSLQSSYLTTGLESYTFGQVTGAVVLTGGSGYTSPSVSFTGGGGSGVAATLTQSGGAVNTITLTNYGSGYSTNPVPTVSDGGPGVGATVAVGIINVNTYDVIGVHVIIGTQRYALQWKPFSEFSALLRQWTATAYQRQPVCWAAYGDTQIFIGPPPDQPYPCEFDTVILPTPFAVGDYTTIDIIPVMLQTAIKFYAAGLAKENNQEFGEAEAFYARYQKRLNEVSSAYVRRVPDIYQGIWK